MSHNVKEGGRPIPIGVNGTVLLGGNHIMGFLAAISGTITINAKDGSNGSSVVSVDVVDAVPVTAGVYTPIPLYWPSMPQGLLITLAGGAKGTLFA
jgi:hypothetical protein